MSDLSAFFRCLRDTSAPLPQACGDEPALRLLIDHALLQIARGLANQGLDALLFKGAALVHSIYARGSARPMSDLDACFQRSRALIAHPSLYVPSAEDHVLLIALDASQNEFRYPQACFDIEMLFRAGVDFAFLLERARRFQAETALYAALEILYFLGAASIRRDYIEALRPSWMRRLALSLLFRSPAPNLFPRARGPHRLGLVWMLRQALLRDDQIAYIHGVLRYSKTRMSERFLNEPKSP